MKGKVFVIVNLLLTIAFMIVNAVEGFWVLFAVWGVFFFLDLIAIINVFFNDNE